MRSRRHITTAEHIVLAILVARRPTFSFELTRQLRWQQSVADLLAVMEGKHLVERNRSGAHFPTKTGCDAVRTVSRSEPSAERWGHLTVKAVAWDWIGGDYDELAETARS
jgi:hypothetical protein